MNDGGVASSAGAGLVYIAIILGMYVMPGIIASGTKHQQAVAIWVVNILLGWTLVGWVVALAWSLIKPAQPAAPIVVNSSLPLAPIMKPMDIADQIAKFAQLRESGAISEGEFEAKKRQLLG